MNPESSRICRGCGKEYPATREYFYADRATKSGLESRCKECHADYMSKYRAKHSAQKLANDPRYAHLSTAIRCELCNEMFTVQITRSHLKAQHHMTTQEYRALGYRTVSPARLQQLRDTPVGRLETKRYYGEDHPNWKGGHLARSGYRIISKRGKKCLYEHRVVAEEMIGRPLRKDEVVHHKDGNRSNNHPDNLEGMTASEHNKMKISLKRLHHIYPETEEAAHLLHKNGWSIMRIALAIRVNERTVSGWLRNTSHS